MQLLAVVSWVVLLHISMYVVHAKQNVSLQQYYSVYTRKNYYDTGPEHTRK
jgi:hypothetical protein